MCANFESFLGYHQISNLLLSTKIYLYRCGKVNNKKELYRLFSHRRMCELTECTKDLYQRSFHTQWTLQWRHNDGDGVSNHQRLYCLLNPSFRRSSKKTSKLRITGCFEGHRSPVTRKMFPVDEVIMNMIQHNYITQWVSWRLIPPTTRLFLQPFVYRFRLASKKTLHRRHNDRDCVSNHQLYECLLNC